MNIIDALKDSAFILPKTNEQKTFPLLLGKCFGEFLTTVDTIDTGSIVEAIENNRDLLEKFCEAIVKCSNTYFNGHPARAYWEFADAMNMIDPFLFPKTNVIVARMENEPYYRARVGSNKQYERKGMFHIPFEMREYVSTQRFSVPGLPCLYLSNSLYVCWEELRRPDIGKMQVSRFHLENHGVNFLDLSLTPKYLHQMLAITTNAGDGENNPEARQEAIDSLDGLSLSYLLKWPLIAACSIRVKKQDGTFKPEYIFPQFLLQWVTENKKIQGVKYFSIEAHIASNSDYSQYINYAIPIKASKESGYCDELINSFSLTEPVSWELLTISNPKVIEHNHEKLKKNISNLGHHNLTLELIKGREELYWHTLFGKLEIEISEMPFEKLKET